MFPCFLIQKRYNHYVYTLQIIWLIVAQIRNICDTNGICHALHRNVRSYISHWCCFDPEMMCLLPASYLRKETQELVADGASQESREQQY